MNITTKAMKVCSFAKKSPDAQGYRLYMQRENKCPQKCPLLESPQKYVHLINEFTVCVYNDIRRQFCDIPMSIPEIRSYFHCLIFPG